MLDVDIDLLCVLFVWCLVDVMMGFCDEGDGMALHGTGCDGKRRNMMRCGSRRMLDILMRCDDVPLYGTYLRTIA